ncbi:MAG TPA: response regulator [Candidatus Acidoferrum sp.]|nr:response regulator [Candidatus Acidoferrum sp.]
MIMVADGSTSPPTDAPLPKRRVLIVEDEGVVGMLLEDMLTDLGYEVAAVAARFGDALGKAETEAYDCAVLDVNLDGRPSFPIAEALMKRGIPFLFVTGYGAKGLDRDFADHPVLAKPFLQTELEAALSSLLKTS